MIFKNTLSNSKSGLKCKIYMTQKIYMSTENCDQFHVPLLIFSHSRKTSSPPFAFPECRSTRQITNSFNDSAKGKFPNISPHKQYGHACIKIHSNACFVSVYSMHKKKNTNLQIIFIINTIYDLLLSWIWNACTSYF